MLPLLVFAAETCVVTFSTIRTIFIARGRKAAAAFLGFFEVSIWLFAIGKVMQNLGNPACSVAFASGFSLGNFLGVMIERKLALGTAAVHVTTRKDPTGLVEALRVAEYGVTMLEAQGTTGPVRVVLTVVQRKELDRVVGIVKEFDAKAFYSIHDLQSAAQGVFPGTQGRVRSLLPTPLRVLRRPA